MSTLFSSREILTMAIEIERNGMQFYNAMAEMTKSKEVRELFTFLAGEEVRHRIVFQEMLSRMSVPEQTVMQDEAYHAYLGALTRSKIFRHDMNVYELARDIHDDIAAIDVGIDTEKDSILFYGEFMNRLFEEDTEAVERVIKEEKSHYVKLVNLREELAGAKVKREISI